jgi:hypothetical protein
MNGEQIMLVMCPDCKQQISSKALACPNCGHPGPFAEVGGEAPPQETAIAPDIPRSAAVAETQKRNKKSGMAWKVGAVVAALLCVSWAGWFFMSGADPDKPHAEKPRLSLGKPRPEKPPLGDFIFDGKEGYINGKGEIVIPPRFDWVGGDFADNGLAYAKENGKWGYIDKTGAFIIPPRFDDAGNFADNGLAAVKENGRYGYIDKTGAFIISPRFDDAGDFADSGLALVTENGIYGYIDKTGTFIIPPCFDKAGDFADNGLAHVKENGKYGYIDRNGQFVLSESEVCETKVLVNARNEVVWPQKTSAQICEEAGQ